MKKPAASIISPLRYPGSKNRFYMYIKEFVEINKMNGSLFIEPFAGSASISVRLLQDNVVNCIAISDADPMVSSFWKILFSDTKWLIDQVKTVKVDLDQWHYYKQMETDDTHLLAMKCLFLNRTSFSGIIQSKAGPIGGKKQESQYTVDCRFPKDKLIKRISDIAELSDRVLFVGACDYQDFILYCLSQYNGRVSLFLDPPYFERAEKLYDHYFTMDDHIRLRDYLINLELPYLLTYDPSKHVEELYDENFIIRKLEVMYTLSKTGNKDKKEEYMISNQTIFPDTGRTWISANKLE